MERLLNLSAIIVQKDGCRFIDFGSTCYIGRINRLYSSGIAGSSLKLFGFIAAALEQICGIQHDGAVGFGSFGHFDNNCRLCCSDLHDQKIRRNQVGNLGGNHWSDCRTLFRTVRDNCRSVYRSARF